MIDQEVEALQVDEGRQLLSGELMLKSLAPIPKIQLYEQICAAIVERIVSGVWPVGQRLPPEKDLARVLGVSRPTLREALGALQMLRVVETVHGSGSRVVESAMDVLATNAEFSFGVSPVALIEARLALEPVIASLAASRFSPDREIDRLLEIMDGARDWENPAHRVIWRDADRLFHRQIAIHANNKVFLSVADHIAAVMAEPLWCRLRDDMLASPGQIERSVGEHRQIYEAVRTGRPEEAARFAKQHLEVVREFMGLQLVGLDQGEASDFRRG